jgi:hypothetical protein
MHHTAVIFFYIFDRQDGQELPAGCLAAPHVALVDDCGAA